MIFIGAEHIISPLGNTALQNFENAKNGISGVKKKEGHNFPTSIITDYHQFEGYSKLESLSIQSAQASLASVDATAFTDKWLFVLSTTKGDIEHLKSGDIEKAKPSYLAKRIEDKLPINAEVMVVSNACISGLLATITAHDLIRINKYDHVLVLGADLVTEFTSRGFKSFYALSESPLAPFDENRTGLSLGEAVSTVILSAKKEVFKEKPVVFAGGASANDANHISGPSRTGEGLVRAINSALKSSDTVAKNIGFISAHGTGTRYNDDMESIAFNRVGMGQTPMNSFKGYFGHTLGTAGVIEIAMTMQSMKSGTLIKTVGCETPGTTEKVNVLTQNQFANVKTILKTASGFGGCNAAAILKTEEI